MPTPKSCLRIKKFSISLTRARNTLRRLSNLRTTKHLTIPLFLRSLMRSSILLNSPLLMQLREDLTRYMKNNITFRSFFKRKSWMIMTQQPVTKTARRESCTSRRPISKILLLSTNPSYTPWELCQKKSRSKISNGYQKKVVMKKITLLQFWNVRMNARLFLLEKALRRWTGFPKRYQSSKNGHSTAWETTIRKLEMAWAAPSNHITT